MRKYLMLCYKITRKLKTKIFFVFIQRLKQLDSYNDFGERFPATTTIRLIYKIKLNSQGKVKLQYSIFFNC